jgi:hypothetical protein
MTADENSENGKLKAFLSTLKTIRLIYACTIIMDAEITENGSVNVAKSSLVGLKTSLHLYILI